VKSKTTIKMALGHETGDQVKFFWVIKTRVKNLKMVSLNEFASLTGTVSPDIMFCFWVFDIKSVLSG
jgi:hypothetical protein